MWRLLTEPSEYESWADAALVSIDPPGPLHAGQTVYLRTDAAGRSWPVRFEILEVDAREHRFALDVRLPLGVVNHEVIPAERSPRSRPLSDSIERSISRPGGEAG